MQPARFDQRVAEELPGLLAELLETEAQTLSIVHERSHARGPDLTIEGAGQTWLVETKPSGGAGSVDAAALQLKEFAGRIGGGVPLLVVPYMSDAGRKAAAARGLNWLDLSGNAHIKDRHLLIRIEGKRNRFPSRGRPSSPFAPKSSRVARILLSDPIRWWRQRDLVEVTDLDDGHMSRVIRKLNDEELLDFDHTSFRPRDPSVLLDAWADEYRFDRHETAIGHSSGSGMDLVHKLNEALAQSGVQYAFTGLPAAWLHDHFAQFRLCSVYVEGLPAAAIESLGLRPNERGANVQLLGPGDEGVFYDQRSVEGIPCVSPVQTYLDLQHLPERSKEAADELRNMRLNWGTHG